ncbi:hypothetical protein, partial [Aequorivita sinensis]
LNSFLGVMLLAITQLSTQQALKIAFQRNFIKLMKYGNLKPETEFKRKISVVLRQTAVVRNNE